MSATRSSVATGPRWRRRPSIVSRRTGFGTRTSTRPRCARRRARACSPGATIIATAWDASSSSRRASPATTQRCRRQTAWCPRSSSATAMPRSRWASGISRPPARWCTVARATAGRSGEASSGSTASSVGKPTSTTLISCTTTTRSTHRARPRRVTTSPRTWSTRRGCISPTCVPRHRRSRSSYGSRPVPAMRLTKPPRRTSTSTRERSTTAGTRIAKRCSRGSARRGCCRAVQS